MGQCESITNLKLTIIPGAHLGPTEKREMQSRGHFKNLAVHIFYCCVMGDMHEKHKLNLNDVDPEKGVN